MGPAGEASRLQLAPELRGVMASLLPALFQILTMCFNGRVSKVSLAFREIPGFDPTSDGFPAEATLPPYLSLRQALAHLFHHDLVALQPPPAVTGHAFGLGGNPGAGQVNLNLERLRQLVRLCLDSRLFSVKQYAYAAQQINEEIRNIITALGAGVKDEFDIAKLRYHRIILMADADVDGAHIRTLLLTFLFRELRPLVDAGHVYIAQPPLFLVKSGKDEMYCFDERERDEAIARIGKKNVLVQRYKGLGEMNPEQLWRTTMNPETRTLVRVTTEDAVEADRIFTILMGEQVEPRRQFIEENALSVKNLDV